MKWWKEKKEERKRRTNLVTWEKRPGERRPSGEVGLEGLEFTGEIESPIGLFLLFDGLFL